MLSLEPVCCTTAAGVPHDAGAGANSAPAHAVPVAGRSEWWPTRTRLKQVMLNLLSKHQVQRENGAVIVECTATANEVCASRCADTGNGLRPTRSARCSSPSPPRPGSRTVEGLGIGLVGPSGCRADGRPHRVSARPAAAAVMDQLKQAHAWRSWHCRTDRRPCLPHPARSAGACAAAAVRGRQPREPAAGRGDRGFRGDLRMLAAPDAQMGIESPARICRRSS